MRPQLDDKHPKSVVFECLGYTRRYNPLFLKVIRKVTFNKEELCQRSQAAYAALSGLFHTCAQKLLQRINSSDNHFILRLRRFIQLFLNAVPLVAA